MYREYVRGDETFVLWCQIEFNQPSSPHGSVSLSANQTHGVQSVRTSDLSDLEKPTTCSNTNSRSQDTYIVHQPKHENKPRVSGGRRYTRNHRLSISIRIKGYEKRPWVSVRSASSVMFTLSLRDGRRDSRSDDQFVALVAKMPSKGLSLSDISKHRVRCQISRTSYNREKCTVA